jgi:hypothetical protein
LCCVQEANDLLAAAGVLLESSDASSGSVTALHDAAADGDLNVVESLLTALGARKSSAVMHITV